MTNAIYWSCPQCGQPESFFAAGNFGLYMRGCTGTCSRCGHTYPIADLNWDPEEGSLFVFPMPGSRAWVDEALHLADRLGKAESARDVADALGAAIDPLVRAVAELSVRVEQLPSDRKSTMLRTIAWILLGSLASMGVESGVKFAADAARAHFTGVPDSELEEQIRGHQGTQSSQASRPGQQDISPPELAFEHPSEPKSGGEDEVPGANRENKPIPRPAPPKGPWVEE